MLQQIITFSVRQKFVALSLRNNFVQHTLYEVIRTYTVGGAISIPLDGLFDLGARVRRQKLNIRTAELEKKMKFEEVQQSIIQLYVSANAQLNILKLRAEAVILSTAQYEISEKDFANGTIDSGVLSNEKEKQSQAIESFENSKAELNKSLMTLEIIAHTKIIK